MRAVRAHQVDLSPAAPCGALLVVLVTAASVQDGPAGLQLLTKTAAAHPAIRKAWADSAYRNTVTEHAARLGIDLEVIRRDPATSRFTPLPRRWAVERHSAG